MFRELESTTRHDNIVFVDEVGFAVVTRPKRGRSPVGQSAYCYVNAARSRNISVAAAINKNGIIYSKIHESALNGETFKMFLVELKNACVEKGVLNPVFVMDNARIHHYNGLNQTLIDERIEIRYLPPYSPFLNPIENVFSVWKNLVIRKKCQNEVDLKDAIESCFSDITYEHCDGFYRKMLRYVTMSSRGETILE